MRKKLIGIFLLMLTCLSLSSCGKTIMVTYHEYDTVATIEVDKNSPVKTPTTMAGYVFDGWYTDSGFTNKYTHDKVTESIELYAKWVKKVDDEQGNTVEDKNLTIHYLVENNDIIVKTKIDKGETFNNSYLGISNVSNNIWPNITGYYVCSGVYLDDNCSELADVSLLKSFDINIKNLYLKFVSWNLNATVLNGIYKAENQTVTIENGAFKLEKSGEVITADIEMCDNGGNRFGNNRELKTPKDGQQFSHYALTNVYCNGVKLEQPCANCNNPGSEHGCYMIRTKYDENFNVVIGIDCIGKEHVNPGKTLDTNDVLWKGTKTTYYMLG